MPLWPEYLITTLFIADDSDAITAAVAATVAADGDGDRKRCRFMLAHVVITGSNHRAMTIKEHSLCVRCTRDHHIGRMSARSPSAC